MAGLIVDELECLKMSKYYLFFFQLLYPGLVDVN